MAQRVRLCRAINGKLTYPCIGSACTAYRRDGKCELAGPNPPDRWQGDAWVIEPTRRALYEGDLFQTMHGSYSGTAERPVHHEDIGHFLHRVRKIREQEQKRKD